MLVERADRPVVGAAAFGCPVLTGAACVRYAIQGETPATVLIPETEAQAAAALAVADAAGFAVVPWGGGTVQAVGNPPQRLDLVLSLERLNQVVSYEPDDLTISLQAGATIAHLHATLAAHQQMLPFDVALPERATIGGAIATNLAGPRRFGAGSYRDLLIGVTVAAPDGVVSKAGGMVVKNVSGYDMMKLHLGALGTLGLLLRLNFKVLTRPAVDVTGLIAGERAALLDLATTLAASQLMLDSLELLGPGTPAPDDEGWRLAVRVTGSEQGVERKRADVGTLCRGQGLTVTWSEGTAMHAWWQQCADILSPATLSTEEALMRVAASSAELDSLLEHVERAAKVANVGARLAAHAGNGILFVRIDGGDMRAGLASLLPALAQRWGHVTLLGAPPAARQGLDSWGALPAGFPMMQRIKALFDPHNTLNPGRFLGGL